MPLQVGAAYSSYSFVVDGVQEATELAVDQLRKVRSVSGSLALQIEKDNARMSASYASLAADLASSNPFAPLISAAAAIPKLTAGPVAQLRKQASADIEGLRQNLQSIRAFAPLGVQAAEASAETQKRVAEIEAAIEKLDVELGHIGIPKAALQAFYNDMGELRNSVLTATGATAGEKNRGGGLFGKDRSRNEVERRMEALVAQEGSPGNLIGQTGGVMNVIEDLIARAKAGHDELGALNQELQNINATAQGASLDPLTKSIVEATAAEQEFVATNGQVLEATKALAGAADDVLRLQQALEASAQATEDARSSQNDLQAAIEAERGAAQDLDAAWERKIALEDTASEAALAHAASIERVASAQRDLNALLGEAPLAQTAGGQGIAGATPGLLAKLQAEAEKQQAKAASEQKARDDQAVQNRLDNENRLAVMQLQTNAQVTTAELNAEAKVNATKLEHEQQLTLKQTQDATVVAKAQIDADAKAQKAKLDGEARIDATRLAGVARVEAADKAAQARLEVADKNNATKLQIATDKNNAAAARKATATQDPEIARLRSFAQAEIQARRYQTALDALDKALKLVQGDEVLLNRIQGTINRVQLLQQGGGGGGPFGPNFLRELSAVAGFGSAAIVVFQGLQRAIATVKDSFNLVAQLDLNRRSIEALIGSVGAGDRVFDAAIKFGQQYGFTQKEMADAAQEAGVVLRTSNIEASKAFEILARLQTRAPGKTFSDAVRAVAELQAGQLQSIERIFNVPSELAQRMQAAIEQGADPIEQIGRTLDQLGNTADVLAQRTRGPAGALINLSLATEDLHKAIGDLITGPGQGLLNWFADVARLGAGTLEALIAVGQGGAGAFDRLFLAAQKSKGLEDLLAFSIRVASGFQITADAANKVVEGFQAIKAPPAIETAFENLQVLNNALDAGVIGLNKYQAGLDRIASAGNVQPIDSEGIIRTASAISDLDTRAEALRTRFNALRREADQDPALQAKYLPQMLAIENELVAIARRTPIVITIEMQLQMAGDLTQAINATVEQAKQARKRIDDINEAAGKKSADLDRQELQSGLKYIQQLNQARLANEKQTERERDDRQIADSRRDEDRRRSDDRSARDYQRGIDQQDEDRRISLGRRARDERLQDQQAEQDHAAKIADIHEKLGDDLARINRETREKLQQSRGDFDVEQRRAQEDFDEERKKLLAEGKIREAQDLTRKFEKDSRRRREDLERGQSRTVDAGDEQKRDAVDATNKQIAAEEKQFAQAQDRLKAQRAQAAADEADDFKRQRDRANAARQQQIDDQVADRKRQDDRENDDREKQDARRAQDYKDQKAALKKAHDEEVAQIQQQRDADSLQLGKDRAAALKALDEFNAATKKKLERQKDDQIAIAKLVREGMSAEAAKALVDLQHAQDDLQGVLDENVRIFAAGGTLDSLSYLKSFAETLSRQIHDAQLAAPPPSTSTAPSRTKDDLYIPPPPPPRRQGGEQTAQSIHISVPIAAPTIDGEKVGSVTAKHVTMQIADDLAVTLDVHEASNALGLQQANSRTLR